MQLLRKKRRRSKYLQMELTKSTQKLNLKQFVDKFHSSHHFPSKIALVYSSNQRSHSSFTRITKLLVILIALLNLNFSLATSNINSIWLSQDEPIRNSNKQVIISASRPFERSGDWHSTSSSQSLQAASSSLQPSIVSIDAQGDIADFNSRSYSYTESPSSHHHNNQSSSSQTNFSNAASSLNHQWTHNQTASNGQVQFDEELIKTSKQNQANVKLEPNQASNRRQDFGNETRHRHLDEPPSFTSDDLVSPSLAQTNSSQETTTEVPANPDEPSVPQVGFLDEPNSTPNHNLQNSTNVIRNKSNLFYISEPDKWNKDINHVEPLLVQSGPQLANGLHVIDSIRPKASFQPNDLRQRSTLAYDTGSYDEFTSEPIERFTTNNAWSTMRPLDRWNQKLPTLGYRFQPRTTQMSPIMREEVNTTPSPMYTFRPLTSEAPILPVHSIVRATPERYSPNQSHQSQGYGDRRPLRNYQQIRAITNKQSNGNGHQLRRFYQSQPIRKLNNDNQIERFKTVATNAILRNPSPIFNYIRSNQQSITRPKKSILGSLGEKLSNWNEPNGSPLESAFYDGHLSSKPNRPKRVRWTGAQYIEPALTSSGILLGNGLQFHNEETPIETGSQLLRPMYTSLGDRNYRPLQPGARYLTSLGHSSVRQPTLAPAPSSYGRLYDFYHDHQSYLGSGSRLPSTHDAEGKLNPRLRYNSGLLEGVTGSNSVGSQQQPANFIPVVAVSVTKTSPAPQAKQQNDLVNYDNSETNDPISDYLEAKVGVRPESKSRSSGPPATSFDQLPDDFGSQTSGSARKDSRQSPYQQLGSSASNGGAQEHSTTVKGAVFGYLPHQADGPLLQAINLLPQLQASRAPSTLGESTGPASEAYTYAANLNPELDEPPSLALQLQAGGLVQNDIAHPFSVQPGAASENQARPNDELYAHSNQRARYQGLHLLPSEASYAQAAGMLSPIFAESVRNPAHNLNPLLPAALVVSNPASLIGRQPSETSETEVGHEQPSLASTSSQSLIDSSATFSRPIHLGQSPAKKGKKRSSEFFANAGQILLSALPLLLAPTLGLMFASSPGPVARYQAAAGAGQGSLQSSIPGAYINSLNSGVVSNASPVPQLFTPTPPGYNLTLATSTPAPTTTVKPSRHSGTKLGVSKRNSTTSQPNKVAILLTTSSPLSLAQSGSGGKTTGILERNATNFEPEPTYLLLTNENIIDQQAQDRSNSSDEQKPLSSATPNNKHHYDIGYEGVDFDAQFASLRKSDAIVNEAGQYFEPTTTLDPISPQRMQQQQQQQQAAILRQQDQAAIVATQLSKPLNLSAATNANERLYPVSTWPTMRRRTVSLVTSNGNRTLLDASEKYEGLQGGDFGQQQHQRAAKFQPNEPSKLHKNELGFVRDIPEVTITSDRGATSVRSKRDTYSQDSGSGFKKSASVEQLNSGKIDSRPPSELSEEQTGEDSSKSSRLAHSLASKLTRTKGEDSTEDEVDDAESNDVTSDNEDDDHQAVRLVGIENKSSANRKLDVEALNETEAIEELRNRLIEKKSILENLATGDFVVPASSQPQTRRPKQLPISDSPFEVTATKIKIYPNQTSETKRSSTNKRTRNGLVLTDDTKRALANFGSLLLKDTLQIPQPDGDEQAATRRHRLKKQQQNSRQQASLKDSVLDESLSLANSDDDEYSARPSKSKASLANNDKDIYETSATEFSFQHTTPYPEEANYTSSRNHLGHKELAAARGDKMALVGRGNVHRYERQNRSSTLPIEADSDMRRHSYGLDDQPIEIEPKRSRDRSILYGNDSHLFQNHDRLALVDFRHNGHHSAPERFAPGSDEARQLGAELQAVTKYTNRTSPKDELLEPADQRLTNYSSPALQTRRNEPLYPNSDQHYPYFNGYYTDPNRRHYSDESRAGYQHPHQHQVPPPPPPLPPPPPPISHYNHPNGTYRETGPYPASPYDSQAPYNGDSYNYNYARGTNYNQAPYKPTDEPRYSSEAYQRPDRLDRPPYPANRYPGYLEPPGSPRAGYPETTSYPHRSQDYLNQSHNSGSSQNISPSSNSSPGYRYHQQDTSAGHNYSPAASTETGPSHMSGLNLPIGDDSRAVNDYLKRVHFSDSDRDKLMASYLTCDGLLNDNDHCLERLSCEFSDPLNIEKANKLDRAVSSILLGHILINTYIPNQFKLRLKSASLFGYTQSGKCSRFVCNKLNKSNNEN